MHTRTYRLALLALIVAVVLLGYGGAAMGQAKGKTSLNKASAAQLMKVPGVTAALAKAIVDYRAKNGPFKKPDDLLKVPGLTQDTLKKMSLQVDPKGDIYLPAAKSNGDDEEEPSLKPSKC